MTSLRNRNGDREGKFAGNKPERAIIDIGSNTVRMVLYGGSPRAPVVLLNEKVVARLGRDIAATGRLAEAAIELALRGLARYALILNDLGIDDIEVVATAAVREADNGPKFLRQIELLGLAPRLLSGEEEARTSAMGVIGAFPGGAGVVADLGGGSLELVQISGGQCTIGSSLPLGTLRLPEIRGDSPADTRRAAAKILKAAGWGDATGGALYLVGGTWRAMATYAMAESRHPLSDPHGFELSAEAALELACTLAQADPSDLHKSPRISSLRSASMPDAAALLMALVKKLEPDRIVFSSWGLREGLLYDRLEPFAQEQDPLLAGVAVFSASRGCPPTLAARVAAWTVGALPAHAKGSERLRLAATMLALASMQSEPNLRTAQAIDWALQKRWIAIDAAGRAVLAAAVCGNANKRDLPPGLRQLAPADALDDAAGWGLAIRLCRRLGALSRKSLQSSRIEISEGKLILTLEQSHSALLGAPNEKDLRLLAEHLGLTSEVRVVADSE
ncbi:Ppx/GppA family phosphatase [Allopontixanthobacter confluentis]|nr:Ppx/GppA family phosphatase [Allopontixanthobacter confluentis]